MKNTTRTRRSSRNGGTGFSASAGKWDKPRGAKNIEFQLNHARQVRNLLIVSGKISLEDYRAAEQLVSKDSMPMRTMPQARRQTRRRAATTALQGSRAE